MATPIPARTRHRVPKVVELLNVPIVITSYRLVRILPSMKSPTQLLLCLAISSLVLGLNLLADGLREVSLKD